MTNIYREGISQVLYVLKYTSQKDVNKIPQNLIKFFHENKAKDYECNLDCSKPVKELDLNPEAKGILCMLYANYWCTNPKSREEFETLLRNNECKYQEMLKSKYDSDNIFKKDIESTQTNENINLENQNTSLIEVEEQKWYKKLFNKIINFFRKA